MVPGPVNDPEPVREPAISIDRVGPGGGVASDSAFGVALVTLWQQVAEAGGPVGFPPPVVRADIAARTAGLIDALRTGRLLGVVANRGRRLVGVGLLRPGRGERRHTGDVELLLVDPANARCGLGTALMDELLGIARERDLDRLGVRVQGGAGLESFFGRFGFAEWGRRPGWIRAGPGVARDEIVLGVQW
ncbi:MAG TPA: GNAT family N-acetyltransferase [Nakamurella sp.]